MTLNSKHKSWIQSWLVGPNHKKEYDVIDGLRGIAILMVVACHVLYHNPQAGPVTKIIGGMINAGSYGVIVFFALSGFLISLPFWKLKFNGSSLPIPKNYIQRRFWKIYPPLALTIVLLTPIYILKSGDNSLAIIALKWLAGIPLIFPIESKLNPVMWSLIFEIQFYITLPILFLITSNLNYIKTLYILFSALLFIPTSYRFYNYSQDVSISLHPLIQSYYPSALDAFAFGVLIGGLETCKYLKHKMGRIGDLGFIILFACMLLNSLIHYIQIPKPTLYLESLDLIVKIGSGLLIMYITDVNCFMSRLLQSSLLRWIGIISYEWYLLHQPIFKWTRHAFGGQTGGNEMKYLLIVGGSSLLSLFLAAIIYRYFSMPILRWGRDHQKANPSAI